MVFADQLKDVERAEYISSHRRKENAAEHCWHALLLFYLMEENLPQDLDRYRVMQLLIIHDLVEIISGDVSAWDTKQRAASTYKDREAARAIARNPLFGALSKSYEAIWDEFENGQDLEAVVARSIDRLQAAVQNLCANGKGLQIANIDREKFVKAVDWVDKLPPLVRPQFKLIVEVLLDLEPWLLSGDTATSAAAFIERKR
jgi:putative hydrolases of HD superfamily